MPATKESVNVSRTRRMGRLFCLPLLISFAIVAAAQETTASLTTGSLAAVHQFGILRTNSNHQDIAESELLDLPDFVHTAEPTTLAKQTWLDFSALYIIPPQMMAGPMTFQVRQELGTGLGNVTAWYPYATLPIDVARRTSQWTDVHVGVQADALESTHPVWMPARAMEAAATLKVYKPGPAGSKRDDVGTTEGDVFLFMRGQASGITPLAAEFDAEGHEWILSIMSLWSDVQFPFTTGTQQGWIARVRADGEITSRRQIIQIGGSLNDAPDQRTSATIEQEPYGRETSDLRWQLNEAIAGNGLRPDEAAAHAELVIQSLRKLEKPALIYMLSPEWINRRLPLKIDGPAEKPVRVFMVITELPTESK